jgi:TonB family protein
MNSIQGIVTGPAAQILGWALLHFIWQGVLIAVVLKLLLGGIPVRLAGLRYWVALAALAAMLCLPGISVWKATRERAPVAVIQVHEEPFVEQTASTAPVAASRPVPDPPGTMTAWQRVARERLGVLAPWIPVFWLGGAVLMASFMLGGMVRSRILLRGARRPAGEGWACKLTTLMKNARFCEPVRLLETDRVSVPTVIGWLRPTILLPAGAADQLAAEHLDALLAHELAHIRRRDYLFNLLQTSIEVLLWYHPATWWVSVQVRAERECCCDDDAVAACGNPLTYARALSRAERLRSASKWAIALSGASLLNRVRRLTEMKTPQIGRFAVCLTGLFAFGLILTAGAGSSLLAYIPAFVAQPSAVAAPASIQVIQAEPVKPAAQDPKNQNATEIKAGREAAAQEKFVRPTEIPRAIDQAKFVQPTEIPRKLTPEQASDLQKLESMLMERRRKLEDLKARLNPTHPDVVQTSRMIFDLEMQIANLRREAVQQATLGPKISGYVYDPTGGVVPGASISVVIPGDRQPPPNAFSNERGYFEIDSYDGVDFELRIEAFGFAPQVFARRDLGAGPLGVTLELGQIKETVTVITGAPTGVVTSDATRGPIRVGGNTVAPKLIRRVDPVYPPEAKAGGIEGIVVVSAMIDDQGQVKDALVTSGNTLLRAAALECVRQWGYSPALINGEPWPMRLSITVVFKLAR